MKLRLLIAFIAFTIGLNAQTITSVTPNSANAGETLQVTITGNDTNFQSISGASDVSFNRLSSYFTASDINYISDTEVSVMVTIPSSAPTGSYDLTVVESFNYLQFEDALQITNNNNTITGNITIDVDGNGCSDSDLNMAGIKVMITTGTSESYTFTNAAGDYIFYVLAGEYVVTPVTELINFAASPLSATINFASTGNLTEIQDFCLTPNGVHNDVSLSILPFGPARPGFDAYYRLAYTNNGNQMMTGTVSIDYDDSILDYVSSTVLPTSQSTGYIAWDYTDLAPFETRVVDIVLNVNSPMETPAVDIDDLLEYNALITPDVDDETPTDNIAKLDQVVVGSYDPNDKAVTEGAEISIDDIDNYLHYLIRFQNTGTFAAEYVRVQDMLSDELDASTLEIVSSSHPYRGTLTEGNRLQFFFDSINLPPEIEDEPGSNGFVAFRIKPAGTVGLGSVIENTAEIYFDFNFPIITNTVATTVTLLSTSAFDFENSIVLYPNPALNALNIDNQSLSEITSVRIFNQLGQLVKAAGTLHDGQMSVGDLQSGTYYVRISSDKGIATKKLIKL